MSGSLEDKMAMTMELMKVGKIDAEAGKNLIERLQIEQQHLMQKQAEEKMRTDTEDAFRYGMAGSGLRGRRKTPTYEDKLCMRMGWHDVTDLPKNIRISMLATHNYIHLTIVPVASEEAVVIKDDINLFPSDMVVTQLRMICNG